MATRARHHPDGASADSVEPVLDGRRLIVLLAGEDERLLDRVAGPLEGLGHVIVHRTADPLGVGALSRRDAADVALVAVGSSSPNALDMISDIVREAACPVIAVLHADGDSSIVAEAAKRGVFAYVTVDGNEGELENALDITLRRFAEFTNLQGAFGRRATIEQAKGILMARNRVDAATAYTMLKSHSQRSGLKLVQVAQAVTDTYLLLPAEPERRQTLVEG
jgi:AmiR/NasT family two-component response regulator